MIDIVIPQVGEAISEVTLVRWLKREGEKVKAGEPLFEVDTDKVTMEVEAFASGTVAKILAPDGSSVMPQDVVGHLLQEGEEDEGPPSSLPERVKGSTESVPENGQPRKQKVSPTARRMAMELGVALTGIVGTGPGGRVMIEDIRKQATGGHRGAGALGQRRDFASPKAKRIARERGLSLDKVRGSGIDGMIVARDVFDLESDREAMGVQPLSKTRRTIAERMQVSKQTVPHFYVNAEIDMSQVEQLRRYCVDSAGWQKAPTYTDIFVRASALAVRDLPEVNVQFRDGGILHLSSVGIGVAVSLREGLVVPAISQADLRSLREISIEIKSLSERARNGKLKESDFAGKSLVVSNLGMYGVDSFTAIIDMPASMILAVGRVVDRVVPVNKQPEVRPMCTINLSVDHRVLDGVDGARFLKRIRDILENPFEIMGGTT